MTDFVLIGFIVISIILIAGIYIIRNTIGQVVDNQVPISQNQVVLIGKLKAIEDSIHSIQVNIKEIKSLTDDIERNQRSL
tara:strand:+ start:215 stop:454 length:240 start_codon:yes stop_codon:yes gene_type:complete